MIAAFIGAGLLDTRVRAYYGGGSSGFDTVSNDIDHVSVDEVTPRQQHIIGKYTWANAVEHFV